MKTFLYLLFFQVIALYTLISWGIFIVIMISFWRDDVIIATMTTIVTAKILYEWGGAVSMWLRCLPLNQRERGFELFLSHDYAQMPPILFWFSNGSEFSCVGFVYPRHRYKPYGASIYFIYVKKGKTMFNLYLYMYLSEWNNSHPKYETMYNKWDGN